MIGSKQDWRRTLADQAVQMDDRQLAAFLRFHEIVTDDDLCDAVDIDARARASAAVNVSLDRYAAALPAIGGRRVVLDAAIEATLRGLRREGLDPVGAVEALKREHPDLAAEIDTAAIFDEFLTSTTQGDGRAQQAGAPPLTLPIRIGEPTPSGERRYLLVRVLGTGSQATVYLATDALLSSADQPAWVAVKVFPRRSIAQTETIAAAEARAVRRIDHPAVVQVLDRGALEDGREFVVFEYVEGAPLSSTLDPKSNQVPAEEAARLIAGLARGLQAAHNTGVLHRDLKPANILVAKDGRAKISDFGLAERVRIHGSARNLAGSFAFMSPEQYRCDERSALATSDIYSMGGILFWALTGLYPNGQTGIEIEQRLWQGETATPLTPASHRPGIDADLAAICRRALAPNPLDRYASADALAADLERFLARLPLEWARPTLARRMRLFGARSPRTASVLIAGVAALMAGSAAIAGAWRLDTLRSLRTELLLQSERADRVEAERHASIETARMDGVREVFTSSLVMLRSPDDAPTEDWLRATIVTEAMMGPIVLGRDEENQPMWLSRIQQVEGLIAQARREGRGHHIDTLLFESLLGYWLVRGGEYARALVVINASIERWTARLAVDDEFLQDLLAVQSAAAYGALVADPSSTTAQIARAADDMRQYQLQVLPDNLRIVFDRVVREGEARARAGRGAPGT